MATTNRYRTQSRAIVISYRQFAKIFLLLVLFFLPIQIFSSSLKDTNTSKDSRYYTELKQLEEKVKSLESNIVYANKSVDAAIEIHKDNNIPYYIFSGIISIIIAFFAYMQFKTAKSIARDEIKDFSDKEAENLETKFDKLETKLQTKTDTLEAKIETKTDKLEERIDTKIKYLDEASNSFSVSNRNNLGDES